MIEINYECTCLGGKYAPCDYMEEGNQGVCKHYYAEDNVCTLHEVKLEALRIELERMEG